MSEDHRFIDALGSIVQGREQMRKGWIGYFGMVPDYRIACEEIIERGDIVAAFGTAGGTYSPDGSMMDENRWEVPAAWRARVVDGLVSEWRVYADNEPIRQLMAKTNQP
jgi:ketosteroid isomerase-like protein